MFSFINVYLDHLKFCVVCVYDRMYVCCGECYIVSNECVEPTSCIVQVMYFGCFYFRGELDFLKRDDVCMYVVNKQFELLEFFSESVYADLQYDEISLTFTAVYMCLCGVCSPVVVLGLSVGCRGTLCCGCGCCGDCDACTVVCVACVCGVRGRCGCGECVYGRYT